MVLFRGVLAAILGPVAFSPSVRSTGGRGRSSENVLTGVSVLVAMTLLFGLSAYTDLPSMIVFAVGALLPGLLGQSVGNETAE